MERFAEDYSEKLNILDVRKPTEYIAEQVEHAQNFPLSTISNNMSEVSKEEKYYLHCRSGFRSTIAASILKARGFDKLVNVQGKYDEISASEIPTSDFVCPSTLKK